MSMLVESEVNLLIIKGEEKFTYSHINDFFKLNFLLILLKNKIFWMYRYLNKSGLIFAWTFLANREFKFFATAKVFIMLGFTNFKKTGGNFEKVDSTK